MHSCSRLPRSRDVSVVILQKMQNRFTSLMHIAIYMYCVKGCALAEPGGRWHPTFALGTRKAYFFHTNHMLGTLDFTGSEHWAPFNFS